MLFQYLQQVQRLIGDADQKKFAPNDLIFYINTARRQVAELTQSVRVLTPISGSITAISILNGGSNYSSPVISITPPDLPSGVAPYPNGLQARASVTSVSSGGGGIVSGNILSGGSGYGADLLYPAEPLSGGSGSGATANLTSSSGGQIAVVSIVSSGSGYSAGDVVGYDGFGGTGFQFTATNVTGGSITNLSIINNGSGYYAPQVTVSDPTGTGAVLQATTSSVTTLIAGQEVYNFSSFPLNVPGVSSVYAVRSVAILYDNYRYILPMYSFTTYQAFVRQYPRQYMYVPTVATQFGQGAGGSLYFYPLPSQAYSFQADCSCIPMDLASDTDPEVIPQPWQDAVPYFAAYLAKLEAQDPNGARGYLELFDKMLLRQSNSARIGRKVNPYGRF